MENKENKKGLLRKSIRNFIAIVSATFAIGSGSMMVQAADPIPTPSWVDDTGEEDPEKEKDEVEKKNPTPTPTEEITPTPTPKEEEEPTPTPEENQPSPTPQLDDVPQMGPENQDDFIVEERISLGFGELLLGTVLGAFAVKLVVNSRPSAAYQAFKKEEEAEEEEKVLTKTNKK